MKSRSTALVITASFAAGTMAFAAAAGAGPQALGLVATAEPVPLQCQYGSCDAFLSAFCLEEQRPAPYKRTAYRPAPGTAITLVVRTRDGRTLRLAGDQWLAFRTNYIYASVTASVDQQRLARLAPVSAAVEVGPLASLVPFPVEHDAKPHSAEELKRTTGTHRRAAMGFFGPGDRRSEAVALTARLINALPRFGQVPADRRHRALQSAMSAPAFTRAQSGSRSAVADTVAGCRAAIAVNRRMTMRGCLELKHGGVQIEVNAEFWKSLAGV